jgi:hypothetical protein
MVIAKFFLLLMVTETNNKRDTNCQKTAKVENKLTELKRHSTKATINTSFHKIIKCAKQILY